MSPCRVMRDPAENKDIVPGTAFYGDQPDAEQGWAEAVAGIKRIRDDCRVLSLTGDAPDQGVYGWENGSPFALDALNVKRLHDRQRREARESGS
jgi:hypothetical protein